MERLLANRRQEGFIERVESESRICRIQDARKASLAHGKMRGDSLPIPGVSLPPPVKFNSSLGQMLSHALFSRLLVAHTEEKLRSYLQVCSAPRPRRGEMFIAQSIPLSPLSRSGTFFWAPT